MKLGVQKIWPIVNTSLWGILLCDCGICLVDVVNRHFHLILVVVSVIDDILGLFCYQFRHLL